MVVVYYLHSHEELQLLSKRLVHDYHFYLAWKEITERHF